MLIGDFMKEIYTLLHKIYLKTGVVFLVDDDDDLIPKYEQSNLNQTLECILDIRKNNYKLYLKILSFLLIGNYSYLLSLHDELTEEIEDEDSADLSIEDEDLVKDDQYLRRLAQSVLDDVDNFLALIDKSTDTQEFDALCESEDFKPLAFLLDANLDLVFKKSYQQICGMILKENDLLEVFLKFASQEDLNQIFTVGLDYLMQKKPSYLIYTLESFYLFSNSMEKSHEFHRQLVASLLQRNLIGSLTTYITDLLWDTYLSYKSLASTEGLSGSALDYINSYENDEAFRQKECYNLIFAPEKSSVITLYLEIFDLANYSFEDCSFDVAKLKKARDQEIKAYIRKLVFKKK